jgi:hypothetical protein
MWFLSFLCQSRTLKYSDLSPSMNIWREQY